MATTKADQRPIGRPQESSERRRSWSWAATRALIRSPVSLVVGEEDLLEGRVGELGADDSRDRAHVLEVDHLGELDLDPAALGRLAEQLVDPLDRDQPAVADDPDPVADPLHLVELVRGEEDRAAALAFLADQGEELLLHQRVEPARSARRGSAARAGGRARGSDRPSGGCRARAGPADGRGRRGSGAPAPRRDRGRRRRAAGQQAQGLAAAAALAVAEVARQVAEPGADRDAVAAAVEAEDAGAAPASGAAGRAGCGSSSSCRPRWVRGSRRPRPARPRS